MSTMILDTNMIKPKGCYRRLMNEITDLMIQCDSVKFTNVENGFNLDIMNDNNRYRLLIPKDYPFRIPQNVYYNDIDYKTLFYNNMIEVNKYLLKYYYKECFCCSSLLCAGNWTPCINICKIINEINENIRIMQEINYRILCDEIRYKYKCYFADIEKYLF